MRTVASVPLIDRVDAGHRSNLIFNSMRPVYLATQAGCTHTELPTGDDAGHGPTPHASPPWPKGPPFTCLGHGDEAADWLKFFYAGPDSSTGQVLRFMQF
jgi:hypothetical protein